MKIALLPVLLVALGCGSRAEAPALPVAAVDTAVGQTSSEVAAVSSDVAPPPSASAPDDNEPDYGKAIQRTIRRSFGSFVHCYEKTPPRQQERITVSFTIGTWGNVISATAISALGDDTLASCVANTFYGISFPMPESTPVKAIYPIDSDSFRATDG